MSYNILGKPKVSEFESTLMNQNILWLDVSVDDAVVYQLLVTCTHLLQIFYSVMLRVVPNLFQ